MEENKEQEGANPVSDNNASEVKEEIKESVKESAPIEKPSVPKKPAPVKPSSVDEPDLLGKMRDNPWVVSTIVLGLIVMIFLVTSLSNITGNTITGKATGIDLVSAEEASASVLELAQGSLGDSVEVLGVNKTSGLYEVILSVEGQELPVYVTLDGKNLVNGLTPLGILLEQMEAQNNVPQNTNTPSSDVPKSDKPVVELFVMTHCPYGTQAEKGMIPALEALGDEINGKIRFVHYFMHEPEETETPIQVCIREEQSEKFLPYLKCFLEDGDSDRCLTEAGVDQNKLDTCISSGKADEYYAEDSALSEQYGVRGSPTLVINGVQAQSGRDSVSYLNAACDAFNTAPGICDTAEVSNASPSPGFGWDGTGSDTDAQC